MDTVLAHQGMETASCYECAEIPKAGQKFLGLEEVCPVAGVVVGEREKTKLHFGYIMRNTFQRTNGTGIDAPDWGQKCHLPEQVQGGLLGDPAGQAVPAQEPCEDSHLPTYNDVCLHHESQPRLVLYHVSFLVGLL